MGLLYCPQILAWNITTGTTRVPGARLYTFDSVATTTPKVTYSDNALTTSNGPYVTSDSLGVFPPIYGAANELYFAELRDPDGNVLDQFPFVATLGPDDTSVLLKDLGTNGRFQVSGVAGVVQIETANAEGDDIGGSGRIGGYGGTQGDALELDYVATSISGGVAVAGNAAIVGALSFGSTIDAWAPISSGAISGASTNIALPSTLNAYRLELFGLTPAAILNVLLRMAFDSVPTFRAGASDYAWAWGGISAGAAASGASGGAVSSIQLESYAAVPVGFSRIVIDIETRGVADTIVTYESRSFADGSLAAKTRSGCGTTNVLLLGRPTWLQILTSTSTMTGRYTLTGKPGY